MVESIAPGSQRPARSPGIRSTTVDAERSPVQISPEQRELLDQVLDKWSLHVLDRLCEHPHRFNELRRSIPDLAQKSLTTTLRRLERNGMVARDVQSTRPIAVEYRITDLGSTLQSLIDALLLWSAENLPAVLRAREEYEDGLDEADQRGPSPRFSRSVDPA
ncbi:helix-turn-helix domain-containing protein [Brachybacterium sp. FME24]|uniref:winged helix-turn-helix transcriptional regulator n=1 Tax=Brachybacterium sp. FME24 TaxID=2742605 RepID=UPI0018695F0F|nr:helix-turn-helix domain-containing protein [Brachybacterium sp. FME24]